MKWRGAESVGAPLLERDEVVLRGQDVRTRTAYSAVDYRGGGAA